MIRSNVLFEFRGSRSTLWAAKRIPHLFGGGCGIQSLMVLLQQSEIFSALDRVDSPVDVELGVDALDVGSDGVHRDVELFCDFRTRQSCRQEPQHLKLALRERLDEG